MNPLASETNVVDEVDALRPVVATVTTSLAIAAPN